MATVNVSWKILRFVSSLHFPDVATSICMEVVVRVPRGLPFKIRYSGDGIIQIILWVDIVVSLAGSKQ